MKKTKIRRRVEVKTLKYKKYHVMSVDCRTHVKFDVSTNTLTWWDNTYGECEGKITHCGAYFTFLELCARLGINTEANGGKYRRVFSINTLFN